MTSKSVTTWAGTVLLVLLGPACKSSSNQTSTTQTTSAETPAPEQGSLQTGTTATTLSKDDLDFITKAAQGSRTEIALGHEATTQAASADVKAFGQRMMADHGKANDELRQLAAQKHVDLPAKLDDDHEKDVDKLGKMKGKDFDKEYADDMVDDHEKDVDEFKKASQSLKDPDLKAWANKTLPVLEHHLAMAKDLKAKVKH